LVPRHKPPLSKGGVPDKRIGSRRTGPSIGLSSKGAFRSASWSPMTMAKLHYHRLNHYNCDDQAAVCESGAVAYSAADRNDYTSRGKLANLSECTKVCIGYGDHPSLRSSGSSPTNGCSIQSGSHRSGCDLIDLRTQPMTSLHAGKARSRRCSGGTLVSQAEVPSKYRYARFRWTRDDDDLKCKRMTCTTNQTEEIVVSDH